MAAASFNHAVNLRRNPYIPSAGFHSVCSATYMQRHRPQFTCGWPANRRCLTKTLGGENGKSLPMSSSIRSRSRNGSPPFALERCAQETDTSTTIAELSPNSLASETTSNSLVPDATSRSCSIAISWSGVIQVSRTRPPCSVSHLTLARYLLL